MGANAGHAMLSEGIKVLSFLLSLHGCLVELSARVFLQLVGACNSFTDVDTALCANAPGLSDTAFAHLSGCCPRFGQVGALTSRCGRRGKRYFVSACGKSQWCKTRCNSSGKYSYDLKLGKMGACPSRHTNTTVDS